ncbi:hypothetical protein FHL15_009215 [Xylaria flabelliformis]|uniref:Fungal N-terminal domain-containing protein n=1 Tax=Xylaria flabelliformis TaxID=2512241 RepID=A0A553HPQ9_9PEZI|nr:hypothetical protein FHL15_009215 [Xylaria flabelliformis]
MEAFTTIQIISSIVQLVDFGSKCVAKGVELYRSNDDVLNENAAIEIAAAHLTTLTNEINKAFSNADQQLQDICTKVTEASLELLSVLECLKVKGRKTKWKSMRKAIKSLENLQTLVESYVTYCDAPTRQIFDAIIKNRNVFDSTLSDRNVLICGLHEETRKYIQQHHETTRRELRQVAAGVAQVNQEEHAKTRKEIQQEAERVTVSNRDSNRYVVDAVGLSAEANSTMHEQTQSQIASVTEALRQLSEQLEARDRELRNLLTDLHKSTSNKKRKLLYERSNAVTAAILALQTMFRSLREILEMLQSGVGNLIETAQSTIIHNIKSDTASFDLISKVFGEVNLRGEDYSNGHFSSRLKADTFEWRQGPHQYEFKVEPELRSVFKFHWDELMVEELQDFNDLLHWLVGSPRVPEWSQKVSTVRLKPDGPALYVAETLKSMGLRSFAEHNVYVIEPDPSPKVVIRAVIRYSEHS